METQLGNLKYTFKFIERIDQQFELRGLRTMLNSGKIIPSILDNVFESACKNDDLRTAKVIAEQFPNRYWYNTNSKHHINRFSIKSITVYEC